MRVLHLRLLRDALAVVPGVRVLVAVACGKDRRTLLQHLLQQSEQRKPVETEPEVFTQDELDAFFKHCNPFQLCVFKTFLMSGLRKQELESLEWDDINWTAGTFKIHAEHLVSRRAMSAASVHQPLF